MPEELTVGQLYYQVVKRYQLPVRNHTHIKKKITELEREVGAVHARHYLSILLVRDLRTEPFDYKPVLNEGLDPYAKRIKVEDYFRRNKPVRAHQMTDEERAAAEAARQAQWND